MKIALRLALSFLLVAVLPLALLGWLGLQAMDNIRALAIDTSAQALRSSGEASIHQKAVDVARQIELYLAAQPDILAQPLSTIIADPQFAAIAVQPVGETGYTAVYDQSGVVYFHANPGMVGRNMRELADALPAFWAIFSASLDGSPSASYYDWQDPDGSIRQKYMSCVPVGESPLRVAATTYIDEFLQPVHQTETRLNSLFQLARTVLLVAVLSLGVLAALLGLWLAQGLSRPILAVAKAAGQVENGQYNQVALDSVASRSDELGQLARHFQRMVDQVFTREQRLKQEVRELRIEIDEAKKRRQVQEITETEYFRELQEKVYQLRASSRRRSTPAESAPPKPGALG